jgi:regulator of cell morphogenesis and NO signaling
MTSAKQERSSDRFKPADPFKQSDSIAATMPGATGIFRRFKLDFCCGGDIALKDAARQGGVDVAEVEHALNSLDELGSAIPVSQQTDDLIDHIVTLG